MDSVKSKTEVRIPEENRKLAEENHNLIYWFLKQYHLDPEEYYDIVALGYCYAAATYNPEKSKFSTYAHVAMHHKVAMHRRSQSAQKNTAILYSLEFSVSEDETLSLKDMLSERDNDIETFDTLHTIKQYAEKLSSRDKEIFFRKINGAGQQEIAKKVGFSQANVSRILKRINNELKEELYGSNEE